MKFIKTTFFMCIVLIAATTLAACKDDEKLINDSYDITAEYYDNGLIAVDLQVNYRLKSKKQKSVVFNLNPKKYHNGEKISNEKTDLSGFNVIDVTVFNESVKTTYYNGNKYALKVDIPKQIKQKSLTIGIKYTITLESLENSAKNKEAVDLGYVIPVAAIYDGDFIADKPNCFYTPLTSDAADYSVKLTVPATCTVAASGKAASCDVAYDRTIYRYSEKNVRCFSFYLSENYNVNIKKWSNKSVINYFYQNDGGNDTLDFVVKCLDFYRNLFGTYPYETFSVCQNSDCDDFKIFQNLIVTPEKISSIDGYRRLASSVAAQWWGCVVGGNQRADYSLFGALREYSSYLFFQNHPEYGVSCSDVEKQAENNLRTCFNDDKAFLQSFPVKKNVDEYLSCEEFFAAAEDLPLLAALKYEKVVGQQTVVENMKNFYENFKFKSVSRSDFSKTFDGLIK